MAETQRLTPEQDPSGVINEISDEIEAGDAHLLTRNELVQFVEWLVTDENSTVVDDSLEDTFAIGEVVEGYIYTGEFSSRSKDFASLMARRFFILKGYEK